MTFLALGVNSLLVIISIIIVGLQRTYYIGYNKFMNCKDFWKLAHCDRSFVTWKWYNKVRRLLKNKVYNEEYSIDDSATVIHHLRDTEEQRKYNDEHYELFGFEIDKDGNEHFEYGKYVVFWTEAYHNEYHAASDETRAKMRESAKYRPPITNETRFKMSKNSAKHNLGKHLSEETKRKISKSRAGKCTGPQHHFYGKHLSEEHILKLSKSHVGNYHTEETKLKMSDSQKKAWAKNPNRSVEQSQRLSGNGNPNYCKSPSDETKKKLSDSMKSKWMDAEYREKTTQSHIGITLSDEHKQRIKKANSERMKYVTSAYKEYKQNGGTISWNEFQKNFKILQEISDE